MAFKKIILASESVHRQALLKQVGLPFTAVPAKIKERLVEKSFNGTVFELADYLSFEKAKSLQADFSNCIIIGSDQVLVFNGTVLHKPETHEDVYQRLNQLQGQTHELITGLCVLSGEKVFRQTLRSTMNMHPLSEIEIRDYIQRDQPLGCAGGYKIEKNGPLLFKSIETQDYFSIIGLPLLALLSTLRELHNLRP